MNFETFILLSLLDPDYPHPVQKTAIHRKKLRSRSSWNSKVSGAVTLLLELNPHALQAFLQQLLDLDSYESFFIRK